MVVKRSAGKISRVGLAMVASVVVFVVVLWSLGALVVSADGPTVTYTYDGAGRLVEADYGGMHIVYTYDDAGNLLSRTVAFEPIYLPLVLRSAGS